MAGPGGHNYRGKRYNPKTGEFEAAQPMSDSAGLAPVNDPDKVYADITRQDYLDYVRDYRDFEKELLEKFREIENEKSNPSIKKFFQKAKSFWKN